MASNQDIPQNHMLYERHKQRSDQHALGREKNIKKIKNKKTGRMKQKKSSTKLWLVLMKF
jgi:hypothetical protein